MSIKLTVYHDLKKWDTMMTVTVYNGDHRIIEQSYDLPYAYTEKRKMMFASGILANLIGLLRHLGYDAVAVKTEKGQIVYD